MKFYIRFDRHYQFLLPRSIQPREKKNLLDAQHASNLHFYGRYRQFFSLHVEHIRRATEDPHSTVSAADRHVTGIEKPVTKHLSVALIVVDVSLAINILQLTAQFALLTPRAVAPIFINNPDVPVRSGASQCRSALLRRDSRTGVAISVEP